MKNKKDYLLLVLRGCAMGVADVIPGVSGGTIAFITGIYEELLRSIKNIDLEAFKLLFTFKFKQFWQKVNGSFLLAVLRGVAISILSLAKLMTYLLATHPIYIWSFFFGLIIASSLLVSRSVKSWNIATVLALITGATVAYIVTVLTPATTPDSWWFIILSGAIAICAMILPGISGSFILLLLGKYEYIMTAISEMNLEVIVLFAFGAVAGLISFSHVLTWLLKHYHNVTIAILTGFMLGSLNKVWPWKESLDITETNISPMQFAHINNANPLLWQAVLMAILGFLLILGIERVAHVKGTSKK